MIQQEAYSEAAIQSEVKGQSSKEKKKQAEETDINEKKKGISEAVCIRSTACSQLVRSRHSIGKQSDTVSGRERASIRYRQR
jgi:hypothetical protein